MPYASNKQAAFIHMHRPDLAEKWHEEGHGYVRGGKNDPNRKKRRRVKKSSRGSVGWLKPVAIGVGTGTVGGALANQFPSYEQRQRIKAAKKAAQKKVAKRGHKHLVLPGGATAGLLAGSVRAHPAKPKKKGVAKRLDAPTWPDDGFFNAKAAQQAYDLVMKMDRDAAEMFVTCVVSEAFEADIDNNRRTLQKHLDEVIEQQLVDLKRATMRVVAKGGDPEEQIAFAQALAVMEEICKPQAGVVSKVKTPYDYGYIFRETDIRRDPGTGQFQTKVKHTQKQPINDKVATSMGIPQHPTGHSNDKAQKFTAAEKAQYQDEYRQMANFLGTVAQSTPGGAGDTRIDMHFEDKNGNQWIERPDSTRPDPKRLNPKDRTLKGITAYPAGLTVGGAAFGLAGAMGGGMTPQRAAQFNAGAAGMPDFATNWTKDYGRVDTNARLYGRTGAAGKLLTEIAPEGSKASLAGHFGNFVGQYGPQAEAVIGPPARRTAYRYRGTEKKPDEAMVSAYETGVRTAMATRGNTEEEWKASRLAENRAVRAKVQEVAEATNTPMEAVRLTDAQRTEALNSARKLRAEKPEMPNLAEQRAGQAAIATYLQTPHEKGGAAPKRGLYNLQLASGNTPPSEGVILDRDGQIVTQAIGYGDDHYLPFNLKNLKGLKGGSYIRNRSVGGLTSEDIYTGLVSGARSVTVVSRSGTFTMDFEPDFRGGRRHNDKAMRMTRRYEQLLDAVQSEQVERQSVDPDIRRAITDSVRNEATQAGFGYDQKAIREQVARRIEDYKSSPDLDADTQEYIDLIVNNRTQGMTTPDANKVRAQVMNDVAADKEYKFRLNGAGYEAALEGLREQFPYYIKVRSNPTKELERHETEPDLGYVEPGKIRPTAAAVGLFGGAKQPQFARPGNKVSAATADYAGPFKPPAQASAAAPATPEGAETPATEGAPTEGAPAAAETPKPAEAPAIAQPGYADAAVAMQQKLKEHVELDEKDPDNQWLQMSPEEFRGALGNKDTVDALDAFALKHGDTLAGTHRDMQPILAGYKQASGRIGGKHFEPTLNQQWNPKPFVFADEKGAVPKAYQAGASDAERFTEGKKIGGQQVGVVNLKPLDQMSDEELHQEVIAVGNIRRTLGGLQGEPDWETKKSVFSQVNNQSPSLQKVFGGKDKAATEKSMDDYLEQVHRVRTMNFGIPAEERGFKETFHPGATPERNEEAASVDRREEMAYLTDKAMGLHAPGSEEYKKLEQLKLDLEMQRNTLNTPDALAGLRNTNPDAITLIMRGLHEGKIPSYRKAPKEEPKQLPPGGGPIIS